MAGIYFLYPQFLWFLFLIPIFIFIYLFSLAYHKKKAFVFSNFQAIERFYGIEFFSKNFFALAFNILILILFIFALAGVGVDFNAETSTFSYVLVIDSSRSMSSVDILPNRFEVAKETSKEFVNNLPVGVNVGVVGFSGESVIYEELRSDKLKVKMGIDNIEFGEAEGTNIYDGVIAAAELFDETNDGKRRAVIIISDGQVNVGSAPIILDYAKKKDLVLHTFAIGTVKGGLTNFNSVSRADLDFLKSLSFGSNGRFFQIENEEDFSEAFNNLIETADFPIQIDLSDYFLMIALVLFTLHWILYNLRFRTFP